MEQIKIKGVKMNKVAVLIGSDTDRSTMEAADKYYEHFGIDCEIITMSAHRNPVEVHDFCTKAPSNVLATMQMPKGVPVATMSVGKSGAINAAILCAEIFALHDEEIREKLYDFKKNGAKL